MCFQILHESNKIGTHLHICCAVLSPKMEVLRKTGRFLTRKSDYVVSMELLNPYNPENRS